MDTKKVVAPVNDLYELLGDSHKGYREASENVQNPKLADFMRKLSNERGEMQAELGMAMKFLLPKSKEPIDRTLMVSLPKAWMAIREAMTGTEEGTMLEKCNRGEDYLRTCYNAVIEDKDTPGPLVVLLKRQLSYIDITFSSIEQLHATLQ